MAEDLWVEINGKTILPPTSFQLPLGKSLAILGPSGGGKSTLLRAAAGLVPLAGGTQRLWGRTPAQWGMCSWRAKVALLPQVPPVLKGTMHDWIATVAALSIRRENPDALSQRTLEIAEKLGLTQAALLAPFSTLSGGERQRLFLSLVLGTEPEVLLLDEPTSALDPDSKALVERLLLGRSAIWVTHDRAQAERVAALCLEIGT